MHHQGRLLKVMLTLVVAMTSGSLILLALEGKPIQPGPYSLYVERNLTPVETALHTEIPIEPGRWNRIDVSYLPNQGQFSPQLGLTGEYAQKYHIVIPDESTEPNNHICSSYRWTKQLACFDPPNGLLDHQVIKICLLTNNNNNQNACTPIQVQQLQSVVDYLIKTCNIEPNIKWHPDIP